MYIPTIREVKELFIKNGYRLDTRPNALNLFGIRKYNGIAGKFDDLIGAITYNYNKAAEMRLFKGTTDPGKPYLARPINPNGTAILAEGQYQSYNIGLHKGKVKAFVQRSGEVTVIRDNDKDLELDYKNRRQSGYFGINIHPASKWRIVNWVKKWSAGCQVVQDYKDFQNLLTLGDLHAHKYGNVFTYTLFNEKEFLDNIQINMEHKPLERVV